MVPTACTIKYNVAKTCKSLQKLLHTFSILLPITLHYVVIWLLHHAYES